MLGGVIVTNKMDVFRDICLFFLIFVVSYSLININIFNNRFIFIVPFIFFCFINGRWHGVVSAFASFIFVSFINIKYVFFMVVVLCSLVVFKKIVEIYNNRFLFALSFYVFFVVLLCSLISNFIFQDSNYFLLVASCVISYWFMRFLIEFYFSFKGEVDFDLRMCSFLFCFLALVVCGLKFNLFFIDFSFILLLILSYISVRVGLDVGAIYSICSFFLLLFSRGVYILLVLFLFTFLIVYFLKNVSKMTFIITYLFGVVSFLYYFNLNYFYLLNFVIFCVFVFFIKDSFVDKIGAVCYGGEGYLKKVKLDNNKSNLLISNKIVRMEEIFSLICEKIDIKGRLKSSEKKLLIEEINVFDNLLKKLSYEVKSNADFNLSERLEREFFKYGVDLLSVNVKENIFKDKVVHMCVNCREKEIDDLLLPLVCKILNENMFIKIVEYDELFAYYRVVLQSKKRRNFKYGVSQKSLDNRVCGDSYLVYENKRGMFFAISDGMGVGKEAKECSKMALDLLRKFLEIDFDMITSLKMMNDVLKSRYQKERYGTLDLFAYDKFLNKFYFCKNGACDSYVFGREKRVIKGNALPLGIVDKNDFSVLEVELEKGELVIMASDGVSEKSIDCIMKVRGKSEQNICECIIKKESGINDDKTVFVIKIC